MERRSEPCDDLELMRRALAVAREEGMEFGPMFEAVLQHIIERPVESEAEGRDRDQAAAALEITHAAWEAAYHRRDLPHAVYAQMPTPQRGGTRSNRRPSGGRADFASVN